MEANEDTEHPEEAQNDVSIDDEEEEGEDVERRCRSKCRRGYK